MNFTAVYEPVAEGGYVAWLEEMPGAQTQGETLAEAKENLLDAFNPSLEYLRDKAIGCDCSLRRGIGEPVYYPRLARWGQLAHSPDP